MVLRKCTFYQNMGQLRVVFSRLRDEGMEVNALKYIFGLKYITYLGYIITWKGIKTDPKNIQGIMDIRLSTTMYEELELIGTIE